MNTKNKVCLECKNSNGVFFLICFIIYELLVLVSIKTSLVTSFLYDICKNEENGSS